MEIQTSQLPLLTPTALPGRPADTPLPWNNGEVLSATVLANDQETLMLAIGDHVVEAGGKVHLAVGENVRLQVEQQGVKILLRLLDRLPSGTAALARALRNNLPLQQELGPSLSRFAAALADEAPPLPEPVAALARLIVKNLPTPQQLATPAGLRQAIQNSGVFLEAHLARPQGKGAAAAGDLKGLLSRLVDLLQGRAIRTVPQPPSSPAESEQGRQAATAQQEQAAPQAQAKGANAQKDATAQAREQIDHATESLLRDAEGALARVKINQTHTLNTHQQQQDPTWVMELPVMQGKHAEVWRLRLRRDSGKRRGGDGEQCWSMTLDFTAPDHGPLHIVVTLIGQRISSTVWAEQETTTLLFRKHLELLRSRLEEVGLEVGRLGALTGRPPQAPETDSPLPGLVDVSA